MVGVSLSVLLVLTAGLAAGCGGKSESSPATHRDADSSGGSGLTANGGSAPGGGGSVQGGGGSVQGGGATTHGGAGSGDIAPMRCESVDGLLAYGPIGEPQPLPLIPVANGNCASSSGVMQVYGIRTAAGYGFVWSVGTESCLPGPNLFSLNLDPNFEGGGAPRALVAENSAFSFNLVPGPNGFVATSCSRESKAEWIQLNGDLDVVQGAKLIAPDAPCDYRATSVLWTGEGYLTSYSDSRGLVVALLDERGAVVNEEILSKQSERVRPRFAKNGDRVLFVFAEAQAWYAVFDLRGTLLGEVQPMGEEQSKPLDLAIALNRDGWWVVTSVTSSTVAHDARLTKISQDGLASPEQELFKGGYYLFDGFTPSAYGGYLLVGTVYSGGQYGVDLKTIALIDDEGKLVCSKQMLCRDAKSWPLAVVSDPLRDLIVERQLGGDFEGMVTVQEYGRLR